MKVLVVDDCRDTAGSTCILLRLWGYDTCAAYDGPSALHAAAAYGPDAVLLDIGLPGMDGYEVARRLRQQAGPALLLLCVSGFGQEDDRRRALDAGCDDHLVKPVDLTQLQRRLTAWEQPAGDAQSAGARTRNGT